MLFLTPALAALRAALPAARISVLVGPWSAALLRGNADVDEVRLCRFPGFERRPKANPWAPYRLLWETAQQICRSGYDTAVVLRFDHWWGAWLAAAAGIRRRIGYDWPETQPFLTEALPYRADRHEVKQNGHLLAVLAPASQWVLGPSRFVVAPEDRLWADGWLATHQVEPGRPLVSIHPGAGAAVKQWPPAAWAAVADALTRDRHAQLLLTGSEAERSLTQAVASAMTGPALDAAGETSLGRLAALQQRCALVLGSDCGPLHLAVAVDVPTVHLYGPVSAQKFGPWGDPQRHVVLTSNWPCVPCNRLDWPASVLDRHRCMQAITVEDVTRAAEALL
jgi:heptosyltransferase-2/heptosyltransferase-3